MLHKKWLLLLVICCLNSVTLLAQKTDTLRNIIPIRVMMQVSSEDYNPVTAIVDQTVLDSAGNELIKAGTEVVLQVTKQKARGSGRPGKVVIQPLRVPTSTGKTAHLNGMVTFLGEDRHDAVVLAAIGGCLFIGPPGLFLLLIKGKPAYVPPGYVLMNIVIKTVE